MSDPAAGLPFEVGPKVDLVVAPSPRHGMGVFARQPIRPNQVVEICPTIFVPAHEEEHLDRTILREYAYPWDGGRIIVLGFGSIYNHSRAANASYIAMAHEAFGVGVHVVTAERPIAPGEEITVNYTGSVTGTAGRLWFEAD